jgi:hypothetical protein
VSDYDHDDCCRTARHNRLCARVQQDKIWSSAHDQAVDDSPDKRFDAVASAEHKNLQGTVDRRMRLRPGA